MSEWAALTALPVETTEQCICRLVKRFTPWAERVRVNPADYLDAGWMRNGPTTYLALMTDAHLSFAHAAPAAIPVHKVQVIWDGRVPKGTVTCEIPAGAAPKEEPR